MSTAQDEDALVEALARSAIERVAPEELPLFRATSAAYFADPGALEQKPARDDLLGFGAEAALVLVSPVALQVARDVIGFVAGQLRTVAREEGESVIRKLAARLVHRREGGGEQPVAELTDEQLRHVRALAVEKARALQLSDAKAALLADALVGSLAAA